MNLTYIRAYLFSAIAAILTGFHLFGIKYSAKNAVFGTPYFYIIISISFFLWFISRIFVYASSLYVPITITHMIMNLSIIVSTSCSILIYKTKVNYFLFFIGIFIMLLGAYVLEKSVTY